MTGVDAPHCPPAPGDDCQPARCQWRCALDVIDELLRTPGAASGDETDRLLDLRWKLRQRTEAEAALRLFCDLRLSMERRHYLAFFRIRRWLENHLLAVVQSEPASAPVLVAPRLDHYCVEAIRRTCLCAGLGDGARLSAPRLAFHFRPEPSARIPLAAAGALHR
jgi:hypothetical protein